VGSVFGDLVDEIERRGLLNEFEHPGDGVFTSWDLGHTDSTAIWFWQASAKGIALIDHHEAHGKPMSYYYDLINGKPYKYIKHWLPHDANQHHQAASGVSILSQCLTQWPGMVALAQELPVLDGIQAGRWLLQQGVRIHPRCHEGVNALRDYHYEYDEEKKTFGNRPAHTWSSHTADAFRYLAAVVKHSQSLTRTAEAKKTPEVPKPIAVPIDRAWNLEQLFEDRDRELSRRRRI
jgi:phage terminase large subunit